MFDWVSYPIAKLVKDIYRQENGKICTGSLPCQMLTEFVACLERLLCFCHTGNTAVFATSLMNPLGLSRGAVKDGFPMLFRLFKQSPILLASQTGFMIEPKNWPIKDHYPAIASKKAQVLTYSTNHFLVSAFLKQPNMEDTGHVPVCDTYRTHPTRRGHILYVDMYHV
jgi:hypothetical protein